MNEDLVENKFEFRVLCTYLLLTLPSKEKHAHKNKI